MGLGVQSRGILRARKRIEGFCPGKTLPLPHPQICDGFGDHGKCLLLPPPPLILICDGFGDHEKCLLLPPPTESLWLLEITEKTQEIPQAQLGSSVTLVLIPRQNTILCVWYHSWQNTCCYATNLITHPIASPCIWDMF